MTRYSRIVPAAKPETSWKTRYVGLSSVPIGVQSVLPAWRYANVTWSNRLAGTAAAISARPDSTPPAGVATATPGAALLRGIGRSARNTRTLMAGTVTVTWPSPPTDRLEPPP